MAWRRATSIGKMLPNGPLTASQMSMTHSSHSSTTPGRSVNFIMKGSVLMAITMGHISTYVVTVTG